MEQLVQSRLTALKAQHAEQSTLLAQIKEALFQTERLLFGLECAISTLEDILKQDVVD